MKYFTALPLAASLAAAQMSVMSMAPAASGMMTHTVTVGGAKAAATPGGAATPQLLYQPESITAAVGDMVEFVFLQQNHTITQSSFANPCVKAADGMDSGFMANPSGGAGVTFNMTVMTTDPQWFYCKQKTGTHCGKGMVFAINAPTTGDKTFSAYKQLAVQQNGTALSTAAIAAAPASQVASTVTVNAGANSVAAASATASVVMGQGTTGDGQACTCQCLCGQASFPGMAAQNNFGGVAGFIA